MYSEQFSQLAEQIETVDDSLSSMQTIAIEETAQTPTLGHTPTVLIPVLCLAPAIVFATLIAIVSKIHKHQLNRHWNHLQKIVYLERLLEKSSHGR